MNTLIKTLAIGLTLISTTSMAGHHHAPQNSYYAKAKVVEVTPVYEYQRQAYTAHRCNLDHLHKPARLHKNKYSKHRRDNDKVMATVVGAAIGGTVANQIFKHSDLRDIGTITGAFIGGAVANDIHHDRDSHNYRVSTTKRHPHKHCKVKYKNVKVLDHYQVTYRYKGNYFTTATNTHPGKKLRIKVKVEPA